MNKKQNDLDFLYIGGHCRHGVIKHMFYLPDPTVLRPVAFDLGQWWLLEGL